MKEEPSVQEATRKTRRRFDRNAPFYDRMEHLMEARAFEGWRARLWELVGGRDVLEVGVGTGKNMPYYPAHARITAIDLSPRMLARARERAAQLGFAPPRTTSPRTTSPHTTTSAAVTPSAASLGTTPPRAAPILWEMDVQHLTFPDESFDAAVSTFVFCSVPDPVGGLSEVRRVLRPGGRFYLLEHVLSRRPVIRRAMTLANPLVLRVTGVNINRDTQANLVRAGFTEVRAEPLWGDVFWLFVARPR